MKIPTYDSNVNVSSRVINGPVVAPSNFKGFSKIASGLESIADYEAKKQAEDVAIHDYVAKNNANLELTKLGAELQDQIQNGGAYANIEKKYDEQYKKIIGKYQGTLLDDKSKVEAMAGWQRTGLEQTLRLKDAVRSRRKSDAAGAAASQVQLLDKQWLDATPEQRVTLAKQYASVYGGLAGTGAISPGEGSARTRAAISGAETNRIRLLAATDPRTAQAELEKNKDLFTADTYTALAIPIMNDVQRIGTVETAVQKLTTEPSSITQNEVDLLFQDKFLVEGVAPEMREIGAIQMAAQTGRVPLAVQNQAAVFLGSYNENMSPADAATAAASARTVTEISRYNDQLRDDSKFSADTQAKAALIVARTEAGMSEIEAVKGVLSMYENKDSVKLFDDGKNKIIKEIGKGEVDVPFSGKEQAASGVKSQFIDTYARYRYNGADDSEAQKLAKKEIKERYKTFNGVVVDAPPQSVTGYSEKSWIEAATAKVKEIAPKALDGNAKIIMQSDYETKRLRAAGAGPNELTFPVQIYLGKNNYFPVMKPDGKPLRVMADPQLMKKDDMARGSLWSDLVYGRLPPRPGTK
jgi:hypothetical protein